MLADQAGDEGHAAGDDVAAALHETEQGAGTGRLNHVVHADDQRQREQRADAAAQKQLYTTDHGGSVMKDYGGKGHRIIHPPKGSGLKFFDQMPKNWRVIDL